MANINIEDKVIGIPLNYCFICNSKDNITRHHVIPLALNPITNVTIPLCLTHKDVLHPIVKTVYIIYPDGIRDD